MSAVNKGILLFPPSTAYTSIGQDFCVVNSGIVEITLQLVTDEVT